MSCASGSSPDATRNSSTPTPRSEGNWPGIRHVNMVKTGDRSYCIIAEWDDMDALAQARPHMIATLNSFRHTLEDLGGGAWRHRSGGRTGGAELEVARALAARANGAMRFAYCALHITRGVQLIPRRVGRRLEIVRHDRLADRPQRERGELEVRPGERDADDGDGEQDRRAPDGRAPATSRRA